ELYPDTIIFVITGAASIRSAVQCIKLGAYDFIPKPFDLSELKQKLFDAFSRKKIIEAPDKVETRQIDAVEELRHSIIGGSEALRELFDLIDIVARSNSTVLITGEMRTRKELVAKGLHRLTPRSNGELVSP